MLRELAGESEKIWSEDDQVEDKGEDRKRYTNMSVIKRDKTSVESYVLYNFFYSIPGTVTRTRDKTKSKRFKEELRQVKISTHLNFTNVL